MRLAGRIKMGYYPTPISIVDRIRSFIFAPEHPVNILDPCCGEGLAVNHLVSGWEAETYGIELDGYRADGARQNLNHVLKCSYNQTRITNGCFSVLFLNPPYDEETLNDGTVTSSERKEKLFLKDTIKYLKPSGLLVYIIPQPRLEKAIAKILSYRFSEVRVFRFHGEEYDAFRQIVIFGIKKKKAEIDDKTNLRLMKVRNTELAELPVADEAMYMLPKAGRVNLFQSTVIDLNELEKEADRSPLWQKLSELSRYSEIKNERPPLPLHQGHIALMLSNGNLDGIVGEGPDRHVVKGKVQKVVVRHQEQTESGYEERELDQYQVSVKVLTQAGEIRHLV